MDRAGMMQLRTVARPTRSPPSASRRGLRWLMRQNSMVLDSCLHGWSARRRPVRAGRTRSPSLTPSFQCPGAAQGGLAADRERTSATHRPARSRWLRKLTALWKPVHTLERSSWRSVHASIPTDDRRDHDDASHGVHVLDARRGALYFPAGTRVPCFVGLLRGPGQALKPSRKTSLGFQRTSAPEWAGRVDWKASRMARASTAEPSALGWSLSLCRRTRVLPSGTV